MIDFALIEGLLHYWFFAVLLMVGFYAIMARHNLIKKLLGLMVFQSAVFLLYVALGKLDGGTAPIVHGESAGRLFSNPLPQVLILTAIVVGIATMALGLAFVVRIFEEYGTIEDDEIRARDNQLI